MIGSFDEIQQPPTAKWKQQKPSTIVSIEKIATLQGAEYKRRNIYTQQVSVTSAFDTRSSQVHAALAKAIITTNKTFVRAIADI